MRILEVKTPAKTWQKINPPFRNHQQCYNAIIAWEQRWNLDGVYRITTVCNGHRVAVRHIRPCDARPARGKSRYTRPAVLNGRSEGPLTSLASLVEKLAESESA